MKTTGRRITDGLVLITLLLLLPSSSPQQQGVSVTNLNSQSLSTRFQRPKGFAPTLSVLQQFKRKELQRHLPPSGNILVNNNQIPFGDPCTTITGAPGNCRPLIRCVRFFFEIELLSSAPCPLANGAQGVCCPHTLVVYDPNYKYYLYKTDQNTNILEPDRQENIEIPNIRPADIFRAASIAKKNIEAREQFEDTLFQSRIFVQRGTSAFGSHRFHATNRVSVAEGKKAMLALETSLQLSNSFKLSKDQGTFALPQFSIRGSIIEDTCPPKPTDCSVNQEQSEFYRRIDGSCNNMVNTSWGKANIPLQRLLPPEYEDGLNVPITKGRASPRRISTMIVSPRDRPDQNYTLLLMQWGQFTDHDISHTPVAKGVQETGIKCCDGGFTIALKKRHRECFPIDIPDDDPLYSNFRTRCMEFVRSIPAPKEECILGPREQVNQITSWIDGSNVYGSEPEEARKLRLLDGGRLRVTQVRGRDLLPLNPAECRDDDQHKYCFAAGDLRCNEQLELTILHTIWLREHNRVAGTLEIINPDWDDDKLYHEARRIIIAEMQWITYHEWLPLILGPKYMDRFNMSTVDSGFTSRYDPTVNPSITNVFSTAAFRFGHSMVQGFIESFLPIGDGPMRSLPLWQTQFKPYELYDNTTIEMFVRGMATQPAQQMDASFSRDLTSHLFQNEAEDFGLDLFSLNIQRGRDHGLAPYMSWRRLCQLPTYSTFKSLYDNVTDIDAFVGMMLEKQTDEGVLGPTLQCLVGDQFARLRTGDRFWFEERSSGFTQAQLEEIRQTSLSRVLCDNAENLGSLQPLAFRRPDSNNRRVSCTSEEIPRMDLTRWRG